MYRQHVWIGLGLLLLAGCYTRVRPDVDGLVCASAKRPVDLLPPEAGAGAASPGASYLPHDSTNRTEKVADMVFDKLLLTSAQEPKKESTPPASPDSAAPAVNVIM